MSVLTYRASNLLCCVEVLERFWLKKKQNKKKTLCKNECFSEEAVVAEEIEVTVLSDTPWYWHRTSHEISVVFSLPWSQWPFIIHRLGRSFEQADLWYWVLIGSFPLKATKENSSLSQWKAFTKMVVWKRAMLLLWTQCGLFAILKNPSSVLQCLEVHSHFWTVQWSLSCFWWWEYVSVNPPLALCGWRTHFVLRFLKNGDNLAAHCSGVSVQMEHISFKHCFWTKTLWAGGCCCVSAMLGWQSSHVPCERCQDFYSNATGESNSWVLSSGFFQRSQFVHL